MIQLGCCGDDLEITDSQGLADQPSYMVGSVPHLTKRREGCNFKRLAEESQSAALDHCWRLKPR